MVKEGKSTATPMLRFPEFWEAGEWEEKLAGDLFSNRAERGEDGLPIYSVTMEHGMVKRSSLDRKIDDISESERNKKVRSNDIAYNMMRMWQGAFGIAVEDCMVSPAYVVLKPQDGVLSDFFGRLLKLPQSLRLLTSHSHGLTKDRLRLYYKDFAQIPLFLPSIAEQQKIADCLTSLDEVISVQGRKAEAIKAHKRGLTQQLFPREGETIPRLRFPEFCDAPEWKTHALSNFVTALDAGVSVNSGDRPASNAEVGILKTSCVTSGVFDASENKVVLETDEVERAKEPVRGNTIIISRMNTPALVGANAYVEADLANIFLPDRLWAAKPSSNGYMRFISYILSSEKGRASLSKLATGTSGSMKNISKSAVLELQILAPELTEQRKIADCLSSFDAQIAAESEKLNALKTHKKGLMQQLFPSPEGD
jgi:type I restriction enzyme S subunit